MDSTSGRLVRAAQASAVGTAAARFGLGSRALVYLTLSVLVTQLALGDRRANTDQGSGIQVLGESPAGVVSLVLLVVGVVCYALWRFSVAATSPQAPRGRVLALVEGLAYVPFGYMAVGVLAGDDAAASQGPRYRGLSTQLMMTSPGRVLVGLVGAVVIVVGLFLASQGVRTTFMASLRLPGGRGLARAVRTVGRIGSTGRGIVFVLAGVLVVYAAIASEPAKTGGIDAAFDTVRAAPLGRYVLLLATLAFVSFALLTLAEAAWREISPPTARGDADDRAGYRQGMADYRADLELGADRDEVFHYLSDVSNLPRYFSRMTSAEAGDGEEVRVTADLGDRTVEGTAWFRIDNDAHSIAWGSEGPHDYRGELSVTEQGLGSQVTVTLTTTRGGGDEIQQGLERTLQNIKQIVVPAG